MNNVGAQLAVKLGDEETRWLLSLLSQGVEHPRRKEKRARGGRESGMKEVKKDNILSISIFRLLLRRLRRPALLHFLQRGLLRHVSPVATTMPTPAPDATRGHTVAHGPSAKVAERKTSGQWFLPGQPFQETPAGTVASSGTVCFGCPAVF